nr:RecName: Full=Alpha-fibrinogenase A2; AltName: Full=Snake venom serine protease; Short=SVSP [Crotalus atrox]AAB31167.1 alpha-fibrinogenase isoform A2 {N-terminal} [Crotalus atrox=Western diamondback rattlesnakes, venom, Peptide Partial, 15 aa] [Crotalus atrox]
VPGGDECNINEHRSL